MDTTILIKTNKVLKNEASSLAKKMGIPLTTVVNAYLAQFVRERKISLSMEQTISEKKLKELLNLSSDLDKSKNIGIKTKNRDELFKHLGL